MRGQLILPTDYPTIIGPLIFLLGPIQGAPNWQDGAIKIIHNKEPRINIASPKMEYLPQEFVYQEQVDWETHYLRQASIDGSIMAWLAKEAEHICDRAYAQTSRAELFEWKVWHQLGAVRLVIGIEEGFSGEKYIQHRFSQDCPDIKIFNTLEQTCMQAIKEAYKSQDL